MGNDNLFLYITILVLSIFIFTNTVNVTIGLVFGVAIAYVIVMYIKNNQELTTNTFDIETEYKMKSLSEDSGLRLKYIYYDPAIINLLFSIKDDIAKSNTDSFIKALKVTDNFLRIRSDFDQVDFLQNDYESFQLAEQEAKKGHNYLHTLIYSVSADKLSLQRLQDLLNRYQLLTKRNLDFMKDRCDLKNKQNINVNTRFITDYDIQSPINKFEDSNVTGSSNFYFFS